MRGPALVVGTIQTVSGRVCSKSLTLVVRPLGKPIGRGPTDSNRATISASLWFGSRLTCPSRSLLAAARSPSPTNFIYDQESECGR